MLEANSIITVLKFISAHNHLREGELLRWIIEAERYYSYLVAMGNLSTATSTFQLVLKNLTEITKAGAMSNLKKFTVDVAREVYSLPKVTEYLTLKKESWPVPYMCHGIPVFLGGKDLNWKIIEN